MKRNYAQAIAREINEEHRGETAQVYTIENADTGFKSYYVRVHAREGTSYDIGHEDADAEVNLQSRAR